MEKNARLKELVLYLFDYRSKLEKLKLNNKTQGQNELDSINNRYAADFVEAAELSTDKTIDDEYSKVRILSLISNIKETRKDIESRLEKMPF